MVWPDEDLHVNQKTTGYGSNSATWPKLEQLESKSVPTSTNSPAVTRLQRGGNNIKSPREKKLEEELLRLTSPPQQPHLLLKKVDNKLPDLSPPSKTSNTNINTTIRSSKLVLHC